MPGAVHTIDFIEGKELDRDAYYAMRRAWEKNHFFLKPTATVVEVNAETGALVHFSAKDAVLAFLG